MPSHYSSLMFAVYSLFYACTFLFFSDIDIVLILKVPKALISMEACMEQKVKRP